jgi:hypothetical protein
MPPALCGLRLASPDSHVADANDNVVDHVAGIPTVDTAMTLIGVSSVSLQLHEITAGSMPGLPNAKHMSMAPCVGCRKSIKAQQFFGLFGVAKFPLKPDIRIDFQSRGILPFFIYGRYRVMRGPLSGIGKPKVA